MLEGHIIDSALDLYKELESGLPLDDFQKNLQIGREMDLDQVVSDLLSSG